MIPPQWRDMPGWQRLVAQYVNPSLQGYVWQKMSSAPSPDPYEGYSYFDLTKHKPGWFNGTSFKYAALEGANSDITSLTGLTTPLSVAQGGTGSGTAAGARTNLGLGAAALEYYEEGSCTITLKDSANHSATMGSNNVFRYARVGSLVMVSGTLHWTSIAGLTAGSRLRLYGLPFAILTASNYRAPMQIGSSAASSFNITRSEITAGGDSGNSFVFLTKVSGNNVDGDMIPADIGSAGTLYGIQITYHTDF